MVTPRASSDETHPVGNPGRAVVSLSVLRMKLGDVLADGPVLRVPEGGDERAGRTRDVYLGAKAPAKHGAPRRVDQRGVLQRAHLLCSQHGCGRTADALPEALAALVLSLRHRGHLHVSLLLARHSLSPCLPCSRLADQSYKVTLAAVRTLVQSHRPKPLPEFQEDEGPRAGRDEWKEKNEEYTNRN